MVSISLLEPKHSNRDNARRQYELSITSDVAKAVPVRINGWKLVDEYPIDTIQVPAQVPVVVPFLVAWRQEDTCVLLVEDGHRVLDKGKHTLIVTAGDASLTLTVKNNGKHNVSVEAK